MNRQSLGQELLVGRRQRRAQPVEVAGRHPLPSINSYTKTIVNADGSIDITFGPDEPKEEGNG